MRVLYLLRREPGKAAREIMEASRGEHDVTVLDLRKEPVDYGEALTRVEEADRVVTW